MKSVFFWRLLIATVLILLLANVISLAAYTYVGKNVFISLEMDELEPQAEYTKQVYEEYKTGALDRKAFNKLIEQQTIAGNSTILIADQIGKTMIVRDIGKDIRITDYGASFAADIQTVLEGGTVRNEQMMTSDNEPAISVGIPVYDPDGSVSGAVFIIKQISSIQSAYQKLSDTLILTIIMGMMVGLFCVFFSARSASKPLIEMADTALEMSKGNFKARANEDVPGETGTLARALNQLCDNLSSTINQLRSEKSQLNSLLISFNDGVAAIDQAGKLTHFNPALQKMFGTLETSTALDVVPDGSIWGKFHEVLETEEPQTLHYRLPGDRMLWITIVPIKSDDGECTGAVGLFKDVTEFEKLEQTRRDYVANVSHELRTPLTAIRGLLEPLADGLVKDDATRNRYYDTMMHEVQRLSRLITDLLQLSRLQSGTEYMEVSAVNTYELLEDVMLNYRTEAEQKGIRLLLNADNVPYAMTDRDRIEQVLVILIDNAMRYTPPDGSIEISAAAGDVIVVSVTDTGCGIAPEELPHLFERFYKVDKSRKDGGTGLGLSIAKQIIDMLGEQIFVESEVGKGTSFSFTLKKYVSNAIALGPTPDYVYGPAGEEETVRRDREKTDEDVPYEIIKPKKTRKKNKKSSRTDADGKESP